MRPSAYTETIIPSFYFEVRPEPDMAARRQWTRDWWDNHRSSYELLTSDAVVDALERGDFPIRNDAIALIGNLPLLEVSQVVGDTVDASIAHHPPARQETLLAIVSVHKCGFFPTWSCRHHANVNKSAHIRRVNGTLGLFVPTLITPLELLGEVESP